MYNFTNLINRLPNTVVTALKNTQQNPKHHAEGSVYNHTEMVFNAALHDGADSDFLVAAIFHDLGKIDCTKQKLQKDGTYAIVAIGHELLCKKYLDKYIYLYDDIVIDINKIYQICDKHMYSHLYLNGSIKKKAKIDAFESLPYFNDIIQFSTYDKNGRIPGV